VNIQLVNFLWLGNSTRKGSRFSFKNVTDDQNTNTAMSKSNATEQSNYQLHMTGALLRLLLPEKVKVILKNIIDNNLFTFIKIITTPEATNLIRYIFKENHLFLMEQNHQFTIVQSVPWMKHSDFFYSCTTS